MNQSLSHNIKLVLAYDGNAYLGWQKTATGPSIESTLQQVLEQILQESITLQAASRTDAGVHAQGQVVNFYSAQLNLDPNQLLHSINKLLPNDIVVLEASKVPSTFHPTLSARGKEYHYFICTGSIQLPQHRLYSWYYPRDHDLNKMLLAAQIIIGKHDFSALCNTKKNSTYNSYEREVTDITIDMLPDDRLCVKVSGINFLYKMVRNIVGTLLHVGVGKLSIEDIPNILNSHNRTQAGVTAPAHGLLLYKVYY